MHDISDGENCEIKISKSLATTVFTKKNDSIAINTGWQSYASSEGFASLSYVNAPVSTAISKGEHSSAIANNAYGGAFNSGKKSLSLVHFGEIACNKGYNSFAVSTGAFTGVFASGEDSIACGLGAYNNAKGKKGCWIVLAEWKCIDITNDKNKIINIKSAMVDGIKIKENTWYKLKNNKFVETEESEVIVLDMLCEPF